MNVSKMNITIKYFEKYSILVGEKPLHIQTIDISSYEMYKEILYTLILTNDKKVIYNRDTILTLLPETITEFINFYYPGNCEVITIEFTPNEIHDPIKKSLVGLIGPIPKQLDETIISYITHVIIKNIKK